MPQSHSSSSRSSSPENVSGARDHNYALDPQDALVEEVVLQSTEQQGHVACMQHPAKDGFARVGVLGDPDPYGE